MRAFLFSGICAAALLACGSERPGQCKTENITAQACTMPTAQAGAPLFVEVLAECGGSEDMACNVAVVNQRVMLTVTDTACTPLPGRMEATGCMVTRALCSIPALDVGSHQVVINGNRAADLVVAAQGETSCHFDAHGRTASDGGTL